MNGDTKASKKIDTKIKKESRKKIKAEKKKASKALSPKKAIRKIVKEKLENLLVNIHPGLKEKSLQKRVKKAEKILVRGIKGKEKKTAEPKTEA